MIEPLGKPSVYVQQERSSRHSSEARTYIQQEAIAIIQKRDNRLLSSLVEVDVVCAPLSKKCSPLDSDI